MSSSDGQPADPTLPAVIADRYVVERLIGRGGMATVYRCIDRRDDSRVAVKVLREEIGSAVVIERFLREIALSSDLKHPRIPQVLDSGVLNGLPFYVMTYIEGESLRARLDREKQLPLADAIRIAVEVAGTMSHAHALGIIHRDIKPANILLAPDGVYILDFGVARAIAQSADERLTSTGIAVGTPAYMSPEQALGEQDLDTRSDVYALGCVTYEMIAGIPPFVGATSQSMIARRFVASAPPLSETRDGVPEHVQSAVARALMKAPADRWQTAEEFAAALASPAASGAVPRFARVTRQLRRHRLVASVVAFLLVAGLAGVILSLSGLTPGSGSERSALDPRRIAVLYFDDHSPDQSLRYLASGLTEGLIQELSGVPVLQVVSRNGVKPFRDNAVRVDSIAAALLVGTIVEGSVQRSGDRLRVTAQIVDASTSTRLESTRIERQMGELFLLEDDLARQVARLLRRRIGIEITLRETEAATRSTQARSLVLQANEARDEAETAMAGDSAQRARGFALLQRADSLLEHAEQADRRWLGPVIERGWIALATALNHGRERSTVAFREAIGHADRALLRDTGNARALELRGAALYSRAVRLTLEEPAFAIALTQAERDLRQAVSLEPALASAWGTLSRVHVSRGDIPAAERAAATAFAMDAYLKDAAGILWSLSHAYAMGDNMENAWRWCLRGARDFPGDALFIDCQLRLLAEDTGRRPDPALAWRLVADGQRIEPQERASSSGRPYLPTFRMMLAAVVSARAGQTDSARAVAARARAFVGSDTILATDFRYDDAFLHLVLGDRAAAVRLLGEYLTERPSRARLVSQDPRWKPLRSDPAFLEAIRRAMAR